MRRLEKYLINKFGSAELKQYVSDGESRIVELLCSEYLTLQEEYVKFILATVKFTPTKITNEIRSKIENDLFSIGAPRYTSDGIPMCGHIADPITGCKWNMMSIPTWLKLYYHGIIAPKKYIIWRNNIPTVSDK